MDDKTKADIEAGVPMVIVHWDKDGNVTSQEAFNLENISLTEWQMQSLARRCVRRISAKPLRTGARHNKTVRLTYGKRPTAHV